MAYCKKCGAYIPDGIGACLACGYDENAGKAAAAAEAERKAAKKAQNDDMSQILERHRDLKVDQRSGYVDAIRRGICKYF